MASSQKFQVDLPFSTGNNIGRESIQEWYIQHVVVKVKKKMLALGEVVVCC